jgi:hypothetical protein
MDLAIPWRSIRKYRLPQLLSHNYVAVFGKTINFIGDKRKLKTNVIIADFTNNGSLIELQLRLTYLFVT